MRTTFIIFVLSTLLFACKKKNQSPARTITPAELSGKWVRGEFDMSLFATWQGTAIQNSALTTGAIELLPDGSINLYSAYFPTDPEAGCNPQLLQVFNGTANFSTAGKMVVSFSGGTERFFYQQCPGKTNSTRTLTRNDMSNELHMFWSVETTGGKTILSIRYDNSGNPPLLFEKKNW